MERIASIPVLEDLVDGDIPNSPRELNSRPAVHGTNLSGNKPDHAALSIICFATMQKQPTSLKLWEISDTRQKVDDIQNVTRISTRTIEPPP